MSEIKMLDVEVSFPDILDVDVDFGQTLTKIVAPEHYMGPFEFHVSDEDQIIPVKEKMPIEDICVKGITGEKTITQNGTYNTLEDKAVNVDVNPDLRPLSVTRNGQYSPDGFDGYSSVTVNNPAQWTTEGIADGSEPYGDIDLGDATRIVGRRFAECINLTGVTGNLVTIAEKEALAQATALKNVHLPRISAITQRLFLGCSALEFLYLPSAQSVEYYALHTCPSLQVLILPSATSFGYYSFDQIKNDYNLVDVVFGHTKIINTEVDAWRDSSFDANGNGGNIYIRKELFDHLGDGSTLDYLSDAKWAKIYAKGNLTFKQIEGSEYETYMPGGAKYEEEMALT